MEGGGEGERNGREGERSGGREKGKEGPVKSEKNKARKVASPPLISASFRVRSPYRIVSYPTFSSQNASDSDIICSLLPGIAIAATETRSGKRGAAASPLDPPVTTMTRTVMLLVMVLSGIHPRTAEDAV